MRAKSHGRYSKEFREEAVKMALEETNSVPQVARELYFPKSTL